MSFIIIGESRKLVIDLRVIAYHRHAYIPSNVCVLVIGSETASKLCFTDTQHHDNMVNVYSVMVLLYDLISTGDVRIIYK